MLNGLKDYIGCLQGQAPPFLFFPSSIPCTSQDIDKLDLKSLKCALVDSILIFWPSASDAKRIDALGLVFKQDFTQKTVHFKYFFGN